MTPAPGYDATIKQKLRGAALPFVVPPLLTTTVDAEFDFATVSHAPMETNSAIADVHGDRAEIWSGLKSPIVAQQTIAADLGLPQSAVTVHVTQGGGSFGRRLFFDAALEAARISKAAGKPVKLLWSRIDDTRHGRPVRQDARPAVLPDVEPAEHHHHDRESTQSAQGRPPARAGADDHHEGEGQADQGGDRAARHDGGDADDQQTHQLGPRRQPVQPGAARSVGAEQRGGRVLPRPPVLVAARPEPPDPAGGRAVRLRGQQ